MIRRAAAADVPALSAFLSDHIDHSMFLLGNLERHGIGNRDHPHGTSFWLIDDGNGLCGVFGRANAGFLMVQVPGLAPPLAQALARQIAGLPVRGITGDASQVAVMRPALGFADDDWRIDMVDPLMAHDLRELPVFDDALRRPEPSDTALLTRWFAAYAAETGTVDTPTAEAEAPARAAEAISTGEVRLLLDAEGAPVAMTGINARAGSAVQVGGVYVPPALRGRGLAGRAIAGHLCELSRLGVSRAVLFAASDAATRAYRRIGFHTVGAYRVAMLGRPAIVEPIPD
ncbi:MAG: GNAT family N-acetyltransferase [Paracoccaceae bacterium]